MLHIRNLSKKDEDLLLDKWQERRENRIKLLIEEIGRDTFNTYAILALKEYERIADANVDDVDRYLEKCPKKLSYIMQTLYEDNKRKGGKKEYI